VNCSHPFIAQLAKLHASRPGFAAFLLLKSMLLQQEDYIPTLGQHLQHGERPKRACWPPRLLVGRRDEPGATTCARHALAFVRKVVCYDPDYPASRVDNGAGLAEAFVAAGFAPVTAVQLADWMRAQVTGGAEGSICFFARDIVPETVAAVCSPDALLVQYMRAGGRVVWVGDMPFYTGAAPGRPADLGRARAAALGLASAWNLKDQVTITPGGTQWGITPLILRPLRAGGSDGRYAGGPCGFLFKNYNPSSLQRLVRLSEQMPAMTSCARLNTASKRRSRRGSLPRRKQAEEGAGLASGTFVVDRARALDKLMRFQLPDPQTCLLPLARSAEAAGAGGLEIKEAPGGILTINFGGAPFTREQLADPYAALFEPRSGQPAARHLATALLVPAAASRPMSPFLPGRPAPATG
jgi:hypothetical protein